MAASLEGPGKWSMTRDEKGHREYSIEFLVVCDPTDGPKTALDCPGLPRIGDPWNYDNDIDLHAFCRPEAVVTPILTNEPNKHFTVEMKFGTKPLDFCQDDFIDNPLLRPMKVSGGFVKYVEEAHYDRFGEPIRNSAHEMVRGQQVEFDMNRPTVKIEQNVADLQLPLLTSMMDTLNDRTMWGLPPRTIKLSAAPWERKFWGACNIYYTRTLEFDIRNGTVGTANAFDRRLIDEGAKVLHGHWSRTTGNWILDNIPPDLRVPTGLTGEASDFGGTLPVGVFTYKITAVNSLGETTPSAVLTVTSTSATGVNIIRWDEIPGATSYKVYGAGDPALGLGFFGFLTETTSTVYVDDGSDTPTVQQPPTTNTTGRPPDPNNPQHFDRFKDRLGEMTRLYLDGFGLPADVAVGTGAGATNEAGYILVEKYAESNFFLLGIPTTL